MKLLHLKVLEERLIKLQYSENGPGAIVTYIGPGEQINGFKIKKVKIFLTNINIRPSFNDDPLTAKKKQVEEIQKEIKMKQLSEAQKALVGKEKPKKKKSKAKKSAYEPVDTSFSSKLNDCDAVEKTYEPGNL